MFPPLNGSDMSALRRRTLQAAGNLSVLSDHANWNWTRGKKTGCDAAWFSRPIESSCEGDSKGAEEVQRRVQELQEYLLSTPSLSYGPPKQYDPQQYSCPGNRQEHNRTCTTTFSRGLPCHLETGKPALQLSSFGCGESWPSSPLLRLALLASWKKRHGRESGKRRMRKRTRRRGT